METLQKNELTSENIDKEIKKLIDKYSESLINLCVFRFSICKEDAEEIVFDVFYKAYIHFSKIKIKEKSSVISWLYKVTKNQVIDFIRRKKRYDEENIIYEYDESENSEEGNIFPEGTLLVFKDIIRGNNFRVDDNKEKVIEVFSELTQDEVADIYCYLNCISYEEIALQTSNSVDAVKKRISRTLIKLEKKLNEKFNLEGKKIYEEIKRTHKEDIKGRNTGK